MQVGLHDSFYKMLSVVSTQRVTRTLGLFIANQRGPNN